MNDRLQHQLDDIQRKNSEHRKNLRIRSVLACMVTLIVLAGLLLPAFTLEKPIYCDKEEHIHSDECYEYVLDCPVTGETGTVISVTEFNKLEGAAKADDTAWNFLATDGDFRLAKEADPEESKVDTDLVLSKAVATDSDYRVVNSDGEDLSFDARDDVRRDNIEQLADGDMNNALKDTASLNNTGDAASHIHTADCYKKTVVCGLEEHGHSLACYADINADIEDAMDIEALFPTFEDEKVKDSYEYAAKLAEFQKGYRESIKNYMIFIDEDDNETTQGYTRYGAWAGDDYAVDWNPLFAAFTTEYAGLDIQSFDKDSLMDAYSWMQELRNVDPSLYDTDSIDPVLLENIDDEGNISLIRDVEGYIGLNYADYLEENEEGNEVLSQVYYEEGHPAVPSVGELVFLDLEGDDFDADHVGIITEVSLNKNRMTVMLGDIDDRVKEEKYVFDDMQVLGYARLPETEEAIRRNIEVNGEPESVTEPEDFGEIELESEADTEEIEESQVELEIAYMDEVVTVEGDDYSVTLNVGSDAKIPEWAEVSVEEITEGSPEYTAYYKDALEAGGKGSEISFARFFDISFSMDGEEIEPAAPVAVSISYDDSVEIPEEGFRKAVHFTSDGGIEVLNVAGETEEAYSDMSDTTEEFIADEEPEETAVMTEAVESAAVKEVKTTDFSKDEAFAAAQSHTEEPGLFGGIKKLGRGLRNLLIKDTHDLESEMGMTETAEPETTETVTAATDNIEEETKDAAVSAASESAVKNGQAQHRKPAKAKGHSADRHTFSFVQESFSVTGTVVYKELTTSYISASGETFVIKVTYGPEAGIPDGAELKVEEILPDDKKYTDYYESARSAVQGEERADEAAADQYARFFDITVLSGDRKVEPLADVSVSIVLKDTAKTEAAEWKLVHFKNELPDVLAMEKTEDESSGTTTVAFVTDSFSVYGVITVPAPASVNDLNGYSVKISNLGYFLGAENVTVGESRRISKTNSESDAPVWTFEATGTNGQYYIYTVTEAGKQYINIKKNTDQRGDADLSGEAQALTVVKNENNYRIYGTDNGSTYYLNQFDNTGGIGFAGWWYNGSAEAQLDFTFVPPIAASGTREYMVVVKQGDDYYVVLNDGTLEPVQYNETDNTVAVDDPMMWKYDGQRLYHVTREAGFTGDDIPSDSYYRYIDPNSFSGLSEDDESNTTATGDLVNRRDVHITARALWNSVTFSYTDHRLQSVSNPGYYIGVDGQGHLKGMVSQEDAVEVFLADPLVQGSDWKRHSVGHIDISINGIAEADVPLAYGKYYDENGNVVKEVAQNQFEKLHLTRAQVVDPEDLRISPADMKRSRITAVCNGEVLDNAFYITGYSGNAEHGGQTGDETEYLTSPQVRIEGSFLVAKMPENHATVNEGLYDSSEAYRNTIRQEHLANQVEYNISVMRSVEFYLQMPVLGSDGEQLTDEEGNPVYQQLYDADGNALKIKVDLAFSDSFTYWDNENECPVFTDTDKWYYYKKFGPSNGWAADDLMSGDVARCGFSGMDFKLGGGSQSNTRVYAIEITKIVVDEQGNRIKSDNIGSTKFSIYRKSVDTIESVHDSSGNEYLDVISAAADEAKDLNIGSFSSDEAYAEGYSFLRDKTIQVGNDGFGLVYDYDVTPALYYIEEDPDSVRESITDTTGKQWDYKQTYIWTEYAWRNFVNDNYMHVGQTYTEKPAEGGYKGVPEILGNHFGYNGTDGPFSNDFLEFYVYNVYESPKVNVPVIKTWEDFEDDQYDWQASFKLQWAPLYEGEERPTSSFQDVTPPQTMTISKSDMEGITQELIARYLSGDIALTAEETARIEAVTFRNLPKYGTDSNGNTFRYQYSLEETSYRVINAATGVILYSWSDTEGYNDPDESAHYQPFYPHDAGETEEGNTEDQNEADTNYYIDVRNALRNISQKEYIDISLDKQWDINDDDTFDTRDDSYWAEFELRRFVHTEYRDISHMSDADRTADPITITIKDGDTIIHTLQVQPNVGLYLGGNFLPHNSEKTVTFTADHPVRLANDSRVSTIMATASGSNMSNALVRSQEFFVTQDTVFTIASGAENLVEGNLARVLDTGSGTSPLPDRSFSQTIRLDNTNDWHIDLEDLIRSETSSGDDDDQENVTFYEYYLVEKDSSPKGYAQYFHTDSNGNITSVLSGDSDHQIEHDDGIIALNGPSNRLIVKKLWRGVPDTTGFPAVTFTLYQTWSDGNEGWVYENPETHARYEHIELKGNSLEWICPEVLPVTRLDGSISRAVKYYVVEDVREGSETKDGITTAWKFYYYINSKGLQTNAGHQGNFASLNGSDLAAEGGTITICNEMNQYLQLDIQKQFFKMEEAGSWNNVTALDDMKKDAILGFKVIRAIKDPDGKWLDDRGNESDTPVWMDYGEEMLCGYDQNGQTVVHRGENDIFWLHDAGGDWHFRIEDNQGDATNVNAGGAGLPSYGFFIKNGEDIPVEYWYSVRETNVYKDLDRTPYPEWDWFSSITPVNAHGPNGQTMEAFPKAFHGQDAQRIANFQASDLIIDKEWIGEAAASAVYVKVWRTSGDGAPEDFTAIIAEDIRNNNNWQMYINDPGEMDLGRNALIIRPTTDPETGSTIWEDAIKVNRALLGALSETGKYHYYIQEVGYRTMSGEYRTNVNGTFKPLYDKWVGTANAGSYTGAPVSMNDYAGNSITIGAKGENRLKVINSTGPSTSYTVTKAFHGPQSSTGGQSSVTGKYPTDGSKQVVVELQQRYRYEKTEEGVDYVSADHEQWVRADSADAATTWCNYESNEGWQSAESASPKSVTLPLDKPEGSILSDEAWYGSAAAWSYTWEGLDVTKVISQAANPEDSLIAQLYYRAVETSTPDWFNSVITAEEQNGHMAVDDSTQTAAEILSEKNAITNEREDCTLELNKEWTGLGEGNTWPDGYVVYYQLIQNFHLAGVNLNGDTAVYSYGDTIKSVNMVTSYSDGLTADSVHPQAVGTLEKANHNLTLTGLPMYGFFTATDEDVSAAAEKGVTLTAGTVYPVVYTYSVKETDVRKNGEEVDFREQTIDFAKKTTDGQNPGAEDGQTDGGEQGSADQTETADTGVYEATLTNEMVSVDVTKTWADDTPYAEAVTVKLYRTTEIPAGELCLVTINLSFGNNYDQIADSTITASVGGKTVELTKDGENDLWTGSVRLEKGTTPTISFTEPNVAEGYTVTVSESQLTVPDAETYTFNASGIVAERQNGRTITVNVTWTDGNNHSATYNNLFYSGWTNTNISSVTSTNGSTQTFVWSGVPTTGSNLFIQLGYNGYNLQNSYTVNVTGSSYSFNNGNELLLGDIPAGDSDVTINVTIEAKEAPSAGTASVTLVNSAGYGIWINQLRYNGDYGNFGGWLIDGASNTISDLPAGEFTVQLGIASASQISGADSIDQWGDDQNPNVNIHISLADGESKTITVNPPAAANTFNSPAAALKLNRKSMRLTGDIPVLAQSVAPSSATVELEHEAADTTLVTVGADDYPVFTQAEFVEEQTLNADNSWHYQWTGLTASEPETGAKYYYYVVEEVPANTKTVTYTRSESNGNTIVTIHNSPVTEPEYARLRVTKRIVDENDETLDISREFTIRLKQGNKYLKWTSSTSYEWVSSADDATTWTFNNGGSVTFTGLETGKTYIVEEDTSTGKIEIDGYTFVSAGSYEVAASSATQYEGTITNKYRLNNIDLNFVKVDASDMKTSLEGAQFTLRKLDPEGKGSYLTGEDAVTKVSGITGDDGTASITDIGDGYYEISETKVPDGYVLTDSGRFYIKVENRVVSLLTFDSARVVTEWQNRTLTEGDKLEFTSETNTFTVGNTPGVSLPSTGGPGTAMIYLLGTLLIGIAAAGALLLKKQQKAV